MLSDTESSQAISSGSDEYSYTTPSDMTDDLDDVTTIQNQPIKINQYAHNVLDHSSQYGSDFSISYTAFNITGRPSKFPDYGDFPETFAMRTYGPWWDMVPSRPPDIMPQTIPEIVSQDYIVIQFEEYVYPEQLCIFETYNPGAVVQVWAYTICEEWILLWQEKPQRTHRMTRIFSPTLNKMRDPTRVIRLDFNHTHLHYFTEIDAVMLTGTKHTVIKTLPATMEMNRRRNNRYGPIQRKLESVQFKLTKVQNHADVLKDFLVNEFENFIIESGMVPDDDGGNDAVTAFTLKDFPCEILFNICSYLDLVSLFRLSQTCKTLKAVTCDPILYTEINLKPYWHLVDSNLMHTLCNRCRLIRKLDMSWCGTFDSIKEADFKEFITECGSKLTHLRLDSMKCLNNTSIELVGLQCTFLKELSLRNYTHANSLYMAMTHFQHLERLDLCQTSIDPQVLLMVLQNNPKLKHINLGFFSLQNNMDDVAIQISKCNRQIVSIDMWKSHRLSALGLMALSSCTELEEVDFGWCLRDEASPGDSLKALVQCCTKLKKLCLASIRGLTDRDLENIANHCENLEQLDLMGVMGISSDKCLEILQKCRKLKLLDLSFCEHLDDMQVAMWKEVFQVDIKRSFVPSQ